MRSCLEQFIGVAIGDFAITLARFDFQGSVLAEQQIKCPHPPTPGAVVVAICEAISGIDPQNFAGFVGVALPGPVNEETHIARVPEDLPGWNHIPLVDWLEPRIHRRVVLTHSCSGHLEAALVAVKRFTSFESFAKAG